MVGGYGVVVEQEAKNELQQIVKYLKEKVSLFTAEKVRDGIQEEIEKLSTMPTSRGLLRGASQEKFIYRRVLKWSYRIIFIVNEERNLVLVVRIDHAKLNPDSLKNLP